LNVALTAAEAGIAGLEFLSGIPGTVGGGFRTNAGAYGTEFKDALISAAALDRRGQLHTVTPAEMGLSYRHSEVDPHWIFVKARFKGSAADPAEIGRRMTEIRAAREASQPIRARTGGSTFANPPGHQAWKLIDEAGCRGLTRGEAMVSEKHTNFLINTGNATAADIEGLGEEVRRRRRDRGLRPRRDGYRGRGSRDDGCSHGRSRADRRARHADPVGQPHSREGTARKTALGAVRDNRTPPAGNALCAADRAPPFGGVAAWRPTAADRPRGRGDPGRGSEPIRPSADRRRR